MSITPVVATDQNGYIVYSYPSLAAAGRAGFTVSKIQDAMTGRQKRHRGLCWQRAASYVAPKPDAPPPSQLAAAVAKLEAAAAAKLQAAKPVIVAEPEREPVDGTYRLPEFLSQVCTADPLGDPVDFIPLRRRFEAWLPAGEGYDFEQFKEYIFKHYQVDRHERAAIVLGLSWR